METTIRNLVKISMRKLLIINPKQFGYVTGYHYYCQYLSDDYEIRYICFDHGMKRMEMEQVDVVYLRQHRVRCMRLFQFSYYVLREMSHNEYDAVFMVYHKLAWLIGFLSRKEEIILDIRTGDLSAAPMIRYLFNVLIRFTAIFYSKVTILSESLLRLLKLNPQKCTVLPLGAERIKCDREFTAMRLLYLGTLTKRNIHQTVEGFARFYRQYGGEVDMSYDIVGFGLTEDVCQLTSIINNLQLQKVIVFHGRKHHKELNQFLDKCNIGVSYVPITPMFDSQPPTKTFEYIMAGMICIATSTAENRLLITEHNGVLCESNEESFFQALNEIRNHRLDYDSQRIASTLESHSWRAIVNNILLPNLR